MNGADIQVRGWPELGSDTDKGRWIEQFFDHALLRFTVAYGSPAARWQRVRQIAAYASTQAQVAVPHRPSFFRPFQPWRYFTPISVFSPKYPSTSTLPRWH